MIFVTFYVLLKYCSRYARQEERDSREADETVPGKNNIIVRGFI